MFNFTAWSICTAATAAATNFTGLLICRILLGVFEAYGLSRSFQRPRFGTDLRLHHYGETGPSCLRSSWSPRCGGPDENSHIGPSLGRLPTRWPPSSVLSCLMRESARRAPWAIDGLSLMRPGVHSVGHAKSGLKPYQSIFLCLGLLSLGLTSVVWWLMPNSPTTAKFLHKGNDRLIAIERLRENNTGTKSSKWQWYQVKETFIDPKSEYESALIYTASTLA